VAATRSGDLAGTHLALAVDVTVTLIGAALIYRGLRPRTPASPTSPTIAEPPVFIKASGQPATLP
jgi:hypothetical protein